MVVVVVAEEVAFATIEHVADAATMVMAEGVADAATMASTGAGRGHDRGPGRHDAALGREHTGKLGSIIFSQLIQSELTRLCVCFSLSRRPPSHLPSIMPFSSCLAYLSDCCVYLCDCRSGFQSLARSVAASSKPRLIKLFVPFELLFCCMLE